MNILVPMAGSGTRFLQHGYDLPKPFIPVNNKPMVQVAVESIKIIGTHIFLTQSQHVPHCEVLKIAFPDCIIIPIDTPTEGAVCTSLFAEPYIDNDGPLLIVNSDQYIKYDFVTFKKLLSQDDTDGAILTFSGNSQKYSYAKVESGYVVQVAEKEAISEHATVGVYYWRHGADYINFAKQMINKNIRTNNEFYICPVFNEAIAAGKKIKIFPVTTMLGMGSPEDLLENKPMILENIKQT
jgi:dTDP-glucose pyrophosphorylase